MLDYSKAIIYLIIVSKHYKDKYSITCMTLTFHDKRKILKEFPITELSYEKKIYKKVSQTELFLIIPKGEKGFIWFRQYKGEPVCLSMSMEKKKQIKNIKIQLASFKPDLCPQNGTILYGTFFMHQKKVFFSIEDIFYFMDKNISSFSQYKKLQIIHILFNEYLKQIHLTNDNIIFGLPYIDTNYDNTIEEEESVEEFVPKEHRTKHGYSKESNFIVDDGTVDYNSSSSSPEEEEYNFSDGSDVDSLHSEVYDKENKITALKDVDAEGVIPTGVDSES
ncbi:unnamed protein product, partial [marine sediment metagenome]